MKAVVFDFDGMVYITPELFSSKVAREKNISLDTVLEFFKNHFEECQKGEKDLKKELSKYLEKWKWKGSVEELMDYWFSDGYMDKEMVEFIEQLKSKGIKCIMCTNNEKYRIKYLREQHNIDKLFDAVVASCEVGARKPDKKIFDEVVKQAGFPAEEILFCDDQKKNTKKAKEYGFKTHLFRNITDFKAIF